MKPYFQEDGITIYHGDCREVHSSLDIVDHVLTDPPYDRYVYHVYQRLSGPNTHKGSGTPGRIFTRPNPGSKNTSPRLAVLAAGDIGLIDEMLEAVAQDFARLVKRWAVVFSDAETTWRWRQSLEGSGMRYVRTGAWVKPDAMPQMSGDRPAVGFEPCTICHAQGAMRWNGGGTQATWTYNTVKKDRPKHPCPKPLGLMCELISLFTDPGEIILDSFMGSGTTLLAAKALQRQAIGIEVNQDYCDVAIERLRKQPLMTGSKTSWPRKSLVSGVSV